MRWRLALCTLTLAALTACATAPGAIEPAPVDVRAYESSSCESLRERASTCRQEATTHAEWLRRSHEVKTGLPAVFLWLIAWPEMIYPAPVVQQEVETKYARAKGECKAIHETAVRKHCPGATTDWPVVDEPPTLDRQAKLDEIKRSTPTCSDEKECDAKWEAARRWVAMNSRLPIQTATGVLIRTSNPADTELAAQVTKEALGGGKYQLVAKLWCDNLFGCHPDRLDALLDFNRTVGAARP